jgi:glycosyltransferase involved in cell wall biosynthesis
MQPLVSILIPAYNAEKWVLATLKSALAQTWSRKEIILVDDGSKDQTLSVARKFAGPQLSVVTQENQGAAAARNKAFSICQGDYVQWLDADDLLAPDKISKQLEALEHRPGTDRTLLSGAWGSFIFRPHAAKFTPTALWSDLSPIEWLLRKFEHCVFMQTGNWLVSRQLSEAAGPWDTRLLGDDDGEYFCRVVAACDSVRFVPESKTFYRVPTSGNLSHIGNSDRKMEAHFLSMKLHITRLRSMEESERVRSVCISYLQWWLLWFYPQRPDLVAQLQSLAVELGGQLALPQLSWKYACIQRLFGFERAKRVQLSYNHFKASFMRFWDKTLFDWENRKANCHG